MANSKGATVALLGILAFAPAAHARHDRHELAREIIGTGEKYLGVPYEFGASMSEAPHRFDCSSFTKYIFGKHGLHLPRSAREQSGVGHYRSKDDLEAGDLMFFKSTTRDVPIDHVALYIGNGKMIHTYGAGGVKIQTVSSWWWSRFKFGRRVIR